MRIVLALTAVVLLSGAVVVALDLAGTPDGSPSVPVAPSGTSPAPADATPDPTPGRAGGTLVMWSREELSPAVAQGASRLAHVTATAFVRSETLGLVGSRDADGRPVDRLADGWRVPVDVVAVDPDAYAAVLPQGPAREAIATLRPGQALLSETAAGLRRLGAGGRIDLTGPAELDVVGVVPDRVVRNAEIVLHAADADAAGMDPDGSVVVRHTAPDGAASDALRAALRDLAPGDRPARVVDAAGRRHRAPLVLSLLEVKSRFGEFAYRPRDGVRDITVDPDWVERHIVAEDVPVIGTVRCHRAVLDDLRAALTEIVDEGLGGAIDPAAYGGCYHPRLISADRDRLSRHSWGIAVDLNVDLSQPGLGPPPPPEIVEILGRHGFRWGGDFLHADNHHFEWIGEEATRRPER